jgi:hypothetical protein
VLEHDPAEPAPVFEEDPATTIAFSSEVDSVRVKKTRQNKKLELGF